MSVPAARPGRVLGVDVARTAALVLMIIAHLAPSDGPGRILMVSEYLTAPLFALLIGSGAQLGQEAGGPHRVRRTLIRAACIALLGLLLEQSSAPIVIVLTHLAVLTVVCLPLARLGTRTLAVLLPLVLAAAIALPKLVGATGVPLRDLVQLLGGQGPYRFAAMLAYAIAGILVTRALRSGPVARAPGMRGPAVAGIAGAAALAGFGALVVLPNVLGLFDVHAYSGAPAETLGNTLGSAGILLVCWGGAELIGLLPAGPAALRLLAAPGAMSLTLYTGQILVLHVAAELSHGARLASWPLLVLLLALGAAAALAWHLLAERRLRARGPLEGAIAALERAATPSRPGSMTAQS